MSGSRCHAVLCSMLLVGPAGPSLAACLPELRTAYDPRVFLGYLCQADCSDEKAGFAWAERHGIGNPAACGDRQSAFRRGCRAFAEEAVTAEQAGFDWARDNEVADACQCDGAGQAFAAGCAAYLDSLGAD